MARFINDLGSIQIASGVFANLAGYAATSCYGVVGMANKNKTDGIVSLLKKDAIVEYGVNIKAVCESIIDRVKYSLESITGFAVKNVTVFVESVRVD